MIFSIDPGNSESAYVVLGENLKPLEFAKLANEKLIEILDVQSVLGGYFVIENIASYGMSVGKEVFETCIWIGRFTERLKINGGDVRYIYRKEETMNLCHSMKAKDGNVIQALVDRFATGQANHGKGTKENPGWFFGFSKDIWQAYAVGVTYHDLYIKPQQ